MSGRGQLRFMLCLGKVKLGPGYTWDSQVRFKPYLGKSVEVQAVFGEPSGGLGCIQVRFGPVLGIGQVIYTLVGKLRLDSVPVTGYILSEFIGI